MTTSNRTLRRVGLVAGTSLLVLAAIGPAASPALATSSGSIQTTGESCANAAPQNDNSYVTGETIYVRGANFAASTAFTWTITGKPGGASSDPNQVVASGDGTSDAAGAFCVAAYVIAADDWGVYAVDVVQGTTSKSDNYRVEQVATEAPGDEGGTTPPADDTTPPADDPTPPSDTTPPADDTTPPADDPTPPSDTTPPADDTTPPADDPTPPSDTTPPSDDATPPPSDDQTVEATDGGNTPPDAPADPAEDADDGSNDIYGQYVLGAVSGGPAVTPPPTDTVVAPSDQPSGIDWRMIVAFLGVVILAATIGLPERRPAR